VIDIKDYSKLLFNSETGKERYSLIPREAEKICNDNSPDKSWEIAMECYTCELYYIQAMAVYIMGLIAHKYKKALGFMKSTVSRNPSWQVQEFLAMAFDTHCKSIGYEKSMKIIGEWLNDKNQNTRRAVTEGLRIWTKRSYFEDNPEEAIKILSKHKTDESEYVRKSAGNALKDISKTYPELVKKELSTWNLNTKEINQVYKLATKAM